MQVLTGQDNEIVVFQVRWVVYYVGVVGVEVQLEVGEVNAEQVLERHKKKVIGRRTRAPVSDEIHDQKHVISEEEQLQILTFDVEQPFPQCIPT